MLRLGFAWILLVVASCSSHEIRSDDRLTVVSGVLDTTGEDPIRIWNQSASYDHVFDSDSFQVTLALTEPGYFKLQYGSANWELYLTPGQNLVVKENKETSSLRFEGRSAASNNYLTQYQLFHDSIMPAEGALYGRSEADFYAAVSQVRDASLDYLTNFIVGHHNLDPVFFEKERARIWYRWGLLLSNYPSLTGYLNQGQIPVGPSYYSFQKELSLNEPGLLAVPEYLPYVMKTIYIEGERMNAEGNDQGEHEIAFNLISKMVTSPLVQDHCYHRVMKNILKAGDLQLAGQLMRTFKQNTRSSSLRREIVSQFEIRKHLEPGNRAPPINLRDQRNRKVHSDYFVGEFLYLFAWKEDCLACKPALRELESLAEDMIEYPIRFVALALDSSTVNWSTDGNMTLVQHFLIDADFHAEFQSRFLLDGVPRAIRIGRDGNIINSFSPQPTSHNKRQHLKDALDSTSDDHTLILSK